MRLTGQTHHHDRFLEELERTRTKDRHENGGQGIATLSRIGRPIETKRVNHEAHRNDTNPNDERVAANCFGPRSKKPRDKAVADLLRVLRIAR